MEAECRVQVVSRSTDPVTSLLETTPLKAIVTTREYVKQIRRKEYIGSDLIEVSTTDTIRDVVHVLQANKITSVPVVGRLECSEGKQEELREQAKNNFWMEKPGPHSQMGVFKGFVDFADICTFIVASAPEDLQLQHLETLNMAGRNLWDTPIIEVIDFSFKNPTLPIDEDHPVAEALSYFAKGLHRVALFRERRLSGICSQTDVVRFLNDKFESGALKAKSGAVAEYLKLKPAGVLQVFPTVTVMHALTKLAMSGARAVAVVSPKDGSLVGNLSASDVTWAFCDVLNPSQTFVNLLLPLEQFLAKFSPRSLQPIWNTPDVLFERVCQTLVTSKVNQLWIVDEKKIPLGVMTLTDVCRVVTECKAVL